MPQMKLLHLVGRQRSLSLGENVLAAEFSGSGFKWARFLFYNIRSVDFLGCVKIICSILAVWVQILASPLTNCETLGKHVPFHLQNEWHGVLNSLWKSFFEHLLCASCCPMCLEQSRQMPCMYYYLVRSSNYPINACYHYTDLSFL